VYRASFRLSQHFEDSEKFNASILGLSYSTKFKTLVNIYQTSQRNISEDLKFRVKKYFTKGLEKCERAQ